MEKKVLDRLRVNQYNRYLAIRQIERLLCSAEFEVAFQKASDSELEFIENCIDKLQVAQLRNWIWKYVDVENIYDLNTQQLRLRAQKLGVEKVHTMNRFDLILAIREIRSDV